MHLKREVIGLGTQTLGEKQNLNPERFKFHFISMLLIFCYSYLIQRLFCDNVTLSLLRMEHNMWLNGHAGVLWAMAP